MGGIVDVDGYGPWRSGGLSAGFAWGGDHIRGGIRQTVTYAKIPYGSNDGEPVIGHTSGYNRSYFKYDRTYVSMTHAVLVLSASAFELELHTGLMHIISSELGRYSIVPIPGGGGAVAVVLPHTNLLVRGGIDVHGLPWNVAYVAQAGVGWRF